MSIGTLALGLYLLLIGLSGLDVISVSAKFLAVLALIAGALILFSAVVPVNLPIGRTRRVE
jgi:hypothetical protein